MDKERQLYIDPFCVMSNNIRCYLWWDWKTRSEVRIEFLGKKPIPLDRFKIISFVRELLIRSGYELNMTKQQFINIQFKEFDGLRIKLKNSGFLEGFRTKMINVSSFLFRFKIEGFLDQIEGFIFLLYLLYS